MPITPRQAPTPPDSVTRRDPVNSSTACFRTVVSRPPPQRQRLLSYHNTFIYILDSIETNYNHHSSCLGRTGYGAKWWRVRRCIAAVGVELQGLRGGKKDTAVVTARTTRPPRWPSYGNNSRRRPNARTPRGWSTGSSPRQTSTPSRVSTTPTKSATTIVLDSGEARRSSRSAVRSPSKSSTRRSSARRELASDRLRGRYCRRT